MGAPVIDSVVRMTTTTVALIFACVLGVTGNASLGQYRDVLTIEISGNTSFAFGGMIFDGGAPLSHEYGHVMQERLLGACYLPLVAVPSLLLMAADMSTNDYYATWPESWATELGGAYAIH